MAEWALAAGGGAVGCRLWANTSKMPPVKVGTAGQTRVGTLGGIQATGPTPALHRWSPLISCRSFSAQFFWTIAESQKVLPLLLLLPLPFSAVITTCGGRRFTLQLPLFCLGFPSPLPWAVSEGF